MQVRACIKYLKTFFHERDDDLKFMRINLSYKKNN